MKHFYLLILTSLLFLSASAVKRTYNSTGDILSPSSWSPIGLENGDILIVDPGVTLEVTGQVDLVKAKLDKITLIVGGVLNLKNGKITLGSQSAIFLSSINAQIITNQGAADQINIGGSEKYDGRSGTIVGPAIANITTASSKTTSIGTTAFEKPSDAVIVEYNSILGLAALPVKFLSFNVSKASNGVSVQWATSEEINADVFQIQRSEDSRTWRTIGTVKAAGNSTSVKNYSFVDKTVLNRVAYYRIKEIDIDGKSTYTDVKNVTNSVSGPVNNVTIIPTGNNVVVNFSKQVSGTVVVRLISFSGQVLAQQTYPQAPLQIVFNRTYVNKGNYIVSVSNSIDLKVSKQIAL